MPNILTLEPQELSLASKANKAEKVLVIELLPALASSIHKRGNVKAYWRLSRTSLRTDWVQPKYTHRK
jgi:hypothetical protein